MCWRLDIIHMHGKCYMLRVQMLTPDDEFVCSKHVEDSIIVTNKVYKVCLLVVLLTYILHDARS